MNQGDAGRADRMEILVERAYVATPGLVEALRRLVPQLTSGSAAPEALELEALLRNDANVLLIARLSGESAPIIGTGSLAVYRVPTGVRAVVEDVVVDHQWQGRGVGEALLKRLLELAREMGARGVSLTSNPRRSAANALYVRMGFSLRKTNCYYYKFD